MRTIRVLSGVILLLVSTAAVRAVGGQATAGQAVAPPVAQQPIGTMSELMVTIVYPASDAIFYIETRTPATEAEWIALQGQALMVAEAGNLLMMPAHRRDDDRWLSDARLMRDAGAAAFRAAKAKNLEALVALNEQLYQSCVTCHQHYRPGYGRR